MPELSRRNLLLMPLAMRAAGAGRQDRVLGIIRAYESQGFHRTATAVDQISADWLSREVRRAGLKAVRESFPLNRVDPVEASLIIDERRIEGLPLFDGVFTDSSGVKGRLSAIGGDGEIGLGETLVVTIDGAPAI